ncbi:hypothetical protein L1887_37763 [Cichorium endivia]|nr:hypothetical protein L1887_37763 [Cichorium endivia]
MGLELTESTRRAAYQVTHFLTLSHSILNVILSEKLGNLHWQQIPHVYYFIKNGQKGEAKDTWKKMKLYISQLIKYKVNAFAGFNCYSKALLSHLMDGGIKMLVMVALVCFPSTKISNPKATSEIVSYKGHKRIGTSVIAVCLRIQVNKENKDFKDLHPEHVFYRLCFNNLVLHLVILNFLGQVI